MAWAIILIVLFVLAVILLLPVRVKGSYGQGAWSVAVYYAFIRVFHKESAPPKEPDVPPKPDEDGSPFFAPPPTAMIFVGNTSCSRRTSMMLAVLYPIPSRAER